MISFFRISFNSIRIRVSTVISIKLVWPFERVPREMLSESVIALDSNSSSVLSDASASRLYDWLLDCHGFWHNAALTIASILFVLYLATQSKQSFLKLSHGRSYIIISYYGCLWLVSILNLAWCFLQVRSWNFVPTCFVCSLVSSEASLECYIIYIHFKQWFILVLVWQSLGCILLCITLPWKLWLFVTGLFYCT